MEILESFLTGNVAEVAFALGCGDSVGTEGDRFVEFAGEVVVFIVVLRSLVLIVDDEVC